jgi:hypothetical protein
MYIFSMILLTVVVIVFPLLFFDADTEFDIVA